MPGRMPLAWFFAGPPPAAMQKHMPRAAPPTGADVAGIFFSPLEVVGRFNPGGGAWTKAGFSNPQSPQNSSSLTSGSSSRLGAIFWERTVFKSSSRTEIRT